jgi:GNAT superfamily N-acetyltransferase
MGSERKEAPEGTAIRPPDTEAEFDAFFRLATATFIRMSPTAVAAADWRRYLETAPWFHHSNVRGAFLGQTYLGGYLIEERTLHLGSSRLRAGCIGAVVTHSEHRRRGIGSAMMRDALGYARSRGHSFLLLNGAAGFYDPFGFIDVFDATEHSIGRAEILAQPPGPIEVRRATVDDAPQILDLYRRHHEPYAGSFERTLEAQQHQIRFAQTVDPAAYHRRDGLGYAPPVVATDRGVVCGYLVNPWGPLPAFGSEVAADTWPAALALLQHDAHRYDTLPEPPDDLRWPLPPDSPTYYHLADHLTLRSLALHRPHGGWMASLIDVEEVLRALLPEWEERHCAQAGAWCGSLVLAVDDRSWGLVVRQDGIDLGPRVPQEAPVLGLSKHALTQLLFGFRPFSRLDVQPGASVPAELRPLLPILFPSRSPWIAPTDGC